jgi:hypothetical protein
VKPLKKKAKAEGKSANQKVAEIIEAKAKESPFPADAEINDYGFLHFRKLWLESLGWSNSMGLKIEKNADGSITSEKRKSALKPFSEPSPLRDSY